jgi:DNA-binding phage protein
MICLEKSPSRSGLDLNFATQSSPSLRAVDEFLQQKVIFDAVQAVAVKRVLAHQLEQGTKAKQLTKTAMAKRMGTTRTQLDRLLDPDNLSATLTTLVKAANAVGKRVRISLVNA